MSTPPKRISCFACQKGSYLFRYVESYRLNRCPSCGVIHLDQLYGNGELVSAFNPETPLIFKKYKTIFDYYFEDRFEKIMKGGPSRNDWLDLGAGHGLWMDFLRKEKRIHSQGVEKDESACQYASSLGLVVSHMDFYQYESSQKYQVITLCEVLEYQENPLKALQKCQELLVEGGLLYLQVPNVMGLKYPYNGPLALPHQLWQFDPKSLFNLINSAGFEMVDYWTGVQGVIEHFEKGTASFTRKLMWKLASELKRGNRLQMLVRKR